MSGTLTAFTVILINIRNGPFFLNGLGVAAPDDYSPLDRPWYKASIAAADDIVETPPYSDLVTGEIIMTYSCSIFDDKGGHLGVICIDCPY